MSPLREITTNKIKAPDKVMCEYCRLVFEKESDLQIHAKEHDGEVNNCRLCDSSFSSKWNLRRHIERLHNEAEDEEGCVSLGRCWDCSGQVWSAIASSFPQALFPTFFQALF